MKEQRMTISPLMKAWLISRGGRGESDVVVRNGYPHVLMWSSAGTYSLVPIPSDDGIVDTLYNKFLNRVFNQPRFKRAFMRKKKVQVSRKTKIV